MRPFAHGWRWLLWRRHGSVARAVAVAVVSSFCALALPSAASFTPFAAPVRVSGRAVREVASCSL
jgi:hypothetical protein